MAKKKPSKQPEPAEDPLEERVRKMMDPALEDEQDQNPKQPETADEISAAIDEAADRAVKTAPEVTSEKPGTKIKVQSDENESPSSEVETTTSSKGASEPEPEDSVDGAETETAPEIPDETQAPAAASLEEDKEGQVPDSPSSDTVETSAETGKTVDDNAQAEAGVDDSPDMDMAVDDIVKDESDEMLKAEDAKQSSPKESKKTGLKQKIGGFFSAWWHNKIARRSTLAVIFIGLAVSLALPASRYFLLNTLGVRSGASVQVIDESTAQPLKNVLVTIGDKSGQTDNDGRVSFERLRLGNQPFVIKRVAFAEINGTVTIGWGSNPLGDYKLVPTGSQYVFEVSDFLSGEPIHKIEAISGEASAFSDEKGLIKLTLDKSDIADEVNVRIIGADYREENLAFSAETTETQKVKLVPARKHVFVSKRSGTYDVYKIDADGKNEELVLKGTGSEREDLTLVPNPAGDLVAFVSTRGGERNKDGFLLSTLNIIRLDGNSVIKIASSERIQVVDWVGERLVYVRIAAGASGTNPKRHRLVSYNPETQEDKELAATNYFNDVFSIKDFVYYAPSSAYQTSQAGLYRTKADGNDTQEVVQGETWNILRKSYEELILASSGNKWHGYNIANSALTTLEGPPADFVSRVYIDSPNGEKSLWVEQRDGKGVLLVYDLSSKKDKILQQQSGLSNPVRWLSDTVAVFRVQTPQETADYVVSVEGSLAQAQNAKANEPRKLVDVTSTGGVDRWYYY